MEVYVGNRFTIKLFVNNDPSYLNDFNTVLRTLADCDLSLSPINGMTEIAEESITGDRLVDGTITSDKLAAASALVTVANNTYWKGRNQADNADLNLVKVNTSDLIQFGIDLEGLSLANGKIVKGKTVAAADLNLYKVNASDHWEFLSDSYCKNVYPMITNTYDIGSIGAVVNSVVTKNLVLTDDSASRNFYASSTFTPTILGETSAGVGTYISQVGNWIRIGNLVTVSVYIDWSGHTGTGNMKIGNLPFTSKNTANLYGMGSVNMAPAPYPGSATCIAIQHLSNQAQANIVAMTTNAASAYVAMDTSCTVLASWSYFI